MTEGVVPYIGTWIETSDNAIKMSGLESYLIQVRGLKHPFGHEYKQNQYVVPYIGTWIETSSGITDLAVVAVVPYIGTWIETRM